MLRFVALNEELDDDEESDEELPVTKEAQGAIAESEYVRAIKLKSQGKPKLALSLFTELLETQVLNEITADKEHEKLWAIRYNCLKNIAIIYEEFADYDLALQNYMHAIQIDDTDVYTMHRFGQLALQQNVLEMAEYAFDKCLQRNPTHWKAADGILQILCRNHNILGACGWALSMYRRNPQYERAAKTLKVIANAFSNSIPFYEHFWGPFPLAEIQAKAKVNDGDAANDIASVFPPRAARPASNEELFEKELMLKRQANLRRFQMQTVDWYALGQYILAMYKHLQETQQCLFFVMSYDDLLLSDEVAPETNGKEMSAQQGSSPTAGDENSSNSATTDSDNPTAAGARKDTANADGEPNNSEGSTESGAGRFAPPSAITTDQTAAETGDLNNEENSTDSASKADGAAAKPKPRRRCSDLHFLEQWGWHKNRRYASRKKPQPERTETDTSLNGFLRKIFSKFMSATFESVWPFGEVANGGDSSTNLNDVACPQCGCGDAITLDAFQAASAMEFEQLQRKLQAKRFDLMVLIYKWLKYMSLCWQRRLPTELQSIYLQLFNCYIKHFDFATWNQLNNNNFEAAFRICLLYLELDYARTLNENGTLNEQWQSTFRHLQFNAGCVYVACYKQYIEVYKLRLINLEYLWCTQRAELELCVTCLKHIGDMMAAAAVKTVETTKDQKTLELHLPYLPSFCLTATNVSSRRLQLQRQIALNRVPKLFEAAQWQDLADIVRDNLAHSRDQHEQENWTRDFKTQIELLLQALWQLGNYDDCLAWAERFLHYTVSRYLTAPKNAYRQRLWAESINYIFTYLEALLVNEGVAAVASLDAGGLLARLVQNVMRLLSHQLDAPFDRNNNPVHELETRRPWVVLHQLLMREEQQQPPAPVKSKPDNAAIAGSGDDDEDLIPNSFLLLFTAHEYLGKRQWCTRDGGALLQYTLDAVTSNWRAPLYDACRDSVQEYVEQITYCLYGYPQKKARSRHLEDHDATQMELNWPRAIRLFDLYRPELLPEFNSYKLESITADMEQLLLKIVTLMPRALDPAAAAARITDFISGAGKKVCGGRMRATPSPVQRLPYKINSLFYLLADYYFKNRDFAKTIRYYPLDLAINPDRFDSWAGMALSKATRIETKLNELAPIGLAALLAECEETLRCFEQCIALNRKQTLLWIEYGSFAYTIHAYCSRYLKQSARAPPATVEERVLAAERKERMLNIAYNCFSLAAKLQNVLATECGGNINGAADNAAVAGEDNNSEMHDEKWLCQFMLGKIAEKRRDEPKVYFNYYLTAASCLYESNATYPIKINHSNPATLSVEALEVFYRTNAAIIKCLEQHVQQQRPLSRPLGELFSDVLGTLGRSPFAFNKAKIDDSSWHALKRKNADKLEAPSKRANVVVVSAAVSAAAAATTTTVSTADAVNVATFGLEPEVLLVTDDERSSESVAVAKTPEDAGADALASGATAEDSAGACSVATEQLASARPSRRESQESAATGTTTTSSNTTSSTSSSDSSSSDSDSDTDADGGASSCDGGTSASAACQKNGKDSSNSNNDAPYSADELEDMYNVAVRNLEECMTRFPEHYKSIYRLVCHYMNAKPAPTAKLARCEQLLLGQYRTGLGNQINGLFYDRKANNLFNGIWRIPSSEIDRPGSFAAHLVKCVRILIELLRRQHNHRMLIDIGLQLSKTPDHDKRYIKDSERLELYQQSISFTAQILREQLHELQQQRDDAAIIELLLNIYKIHKKCVKYITPKEPLFTQLMVDVYRWYIHDKVECVPEHLNFLDLAIKLCLQELSVRKNAEKAAAAANSSSGYVGSHATAGGYAAASGANINLGDVILGFNTTASSSKPSGAAAALPPSRPIQIPGLQPRAPRNRSLGSKIEPLASTVLSPMPLSTPPATTNSFINDVLQSPNFMSMISSLNASAIVQQDAVGFQNLVAEYYKQIMEANRVAGLSAGAVAAAPSASTTTSTALSVPLMAPKVAPAFPGGLVNTLPVETTITPAQSPAAVPNVRLPTFDLTITPALDIKPVMTTTAPSMLSAAVTTAAPSGIFVKPLANLQELPDLPDSLTITTLTKAQVASATAAAVTPAMPTVTAEVSGRSTAPIRAGKSGKGKQANKPYTRPDAASGSLLLDSYSQQQRQQLSLMATYADLLKNTSVEQFQSLTQKPRPSAPSTGGRRKTTPPPPPPHSTVLGDTPSGKESPFALPVSFDANAITMTALPTLPASKRSSPSLLAARAAARTASTPSPPVFTPPPPAGTPPNVATVNFPLTVSPTKTLQQKLAERQKANLQLNESKTPAASGSGGRKPNIDVIILD